MRPSPADLPATDLLLVGAHAPDLRGLRDRLGERLVGRLGAHAVLGKVVGVGGAVAAAGTMRRLVLVEPRAVVLVGTCGVYPGLEGYRPYDVVVATRVALVSLAVDDGRAAFPEALRSRLEPTDSLVEGLRDAAPRAHGVGVASTQAHTLNDALAADVPRRHGCEVENLEAFAVAQACQRQGVPWVCVLGVTHVVGSQAVADRRRFQKDAASAAMDAVAGWLEAGAPGLPERA
ncbi:MAG: hypothetical protein AAGH15_06545 [Myxococcota bacterium]